MAVCVAAGFTTLLDSAVLGIGVPSIRASLDASTSEVQWILASYSLTFGLALVPAGRLGDVVGRRRLFLFGLSIFAVMGILGACASDPSMIILARLGQGIGAGTISSQVLGIITDRVSGKSRAKALGAYSTAGGLAGVSGPILGGLLLKYFDPDFGWRLLLVLNVPFAVVTLVLAFRFLRRDRTTRSGASIDPVGLCLLAAATGLLLLPIVTRTSVVVAGVSLVGAVSAAVAFWFWERRYAAGGGTPVLLPSLIASRGFRLGTTVALFWFGSILAINAVLSLYLIEGLGFAPLSAAFIMTGSSLAMAVTSAFGWRLVARFGRSAVAFAIVGEILVVLGYTASVNLVPREHLIPVLVVLAVFSGVASGFVDAPNRVLTLEYAPAGANGVAAGFLQLSQRLSATIALAAVSGLYLGVLGSSTSYGSALGIALAVCVAMLALSLVAAVADTRRRRVRVE
ncbi:MFS transporter [Rhodococcus sp. KBS0724]|uniref:MFS transporter n=1 Tax=Rhodococcus sp. KBS0724 TaxID=1179674 RepID=UPI00163D51C6|nr:MFS transporter [Rhodococcus sp. KBS0724]